MPSPRLDLITTTGPAGYDLIDSGAGRKLERFGTIVVDRPEVQAMWQPALSHADWAKAHAVFSASGEDEEKGRWRFDKAVPESWPVEVAGVTMLCKLAGLWHLGLFPEQLPHWEWMEERLAPGGRLPAEGPPGAQKNVLNLFGYTGAASLIAAKANAEVVHVDASKKAIAWARENQAASGLGDRPIRWICEDARKFVSREVRRGRTYHSILIDPPKFGRGPDGEIWDLFTHLPLLLADCVKLLPPQRAHIILTAYAIRASALALDGLMREALADRGGTIESGELAIGEQSGRQTIGTSLYSRWRSP
jgi:23S rRNA (cytosine1962-C5)-methyltransferase